MSNLYTLGYKYDYTFTFNINITHCTYKLNKPKYYSEF